MKKIISLISLILIILILSLILCFFASCAAEPADSSLADILKKYKKNGLSLWWEAVAVYNAGENPADYKNFEDLYLSLKGAPYVIVADIAVIKGMSREKFEKYEEYKSNLKDILENPPENYTVNNYIFAYFALKCSGAGFNETAFYRNIIEAKKNDGGFAVSGNSGDVDITALALTALRLFFISNDIDWISPTPFEDTENFLESKINENGAFASIFSSGEPNANSTACALSALIGYYDGAENEIIKKAAAGLELFNAGGKKDAGYSYLPGGAADALATAQAAIALGDLENNMPVWMKLYQDYVNYVNYTERIDGN